MLGRRPLRFGLEAGALVAVAASVAVADVRPLLIAAFMVLAWAIVSVLEWSFLQREAHYKRGLPPRYYVPQLRLPASPSTASPSAVSEPEPAVEVDYRRLFDNLGGREPIEVSWFDRELPGATVPRTSRALDEPLDEEMPEEPPQLPPAEEPSSTEPETARTFLEPEPEEVVEVDYEAAAYQLYATDEPDLASWFDTELPGGVAAAPPSASATLYAVDDSDDPNGDRPRPQRDA